MCYSAQIWADYRKYVRAWGAVLDIKAFVKEFWERHERPTMSFPRAMEAAFSDANTPEEREIADLIAKHRAAQATKLQAELFKQRRRLADATRVLQTRTIKKAQNDQRIAASKIDWAMQKLADMSRSQLTEQDSRIFPGWYAPVMVMQNGKRMIRPMRYQLRPPTVSSDFDKTHPGSYCARRDNLERFWRGQFGVTHGLIVAQAFYENVKRHDVERRDLAPGEREENVILEFRPRPTQDMLVACLWAHWQREGESLHSFAVITDDPPEEIAATGHDRCIIPIKPEHIDAWLSPDPKNLTACHAILDDRDRPYYEHRAAA